ncbi:hypothetical protein IMCC3317_35410 [Kordia antarctica]|uniref:Uncharacterized protein n=1 Tax=Kordia antarctica TaxID=1218801 RepID=A0A7L4ZQJ9_9FLAO|nr:hypothetical protein [Kordia antarctica]QHI38154.1 hypothetical protein IMCC3317_35410 [Kordia antarctica]
MKKKKINLEKLNLNKTNIANFHIKGGMMEASVFVACPEPEPTGIACKPSKWCNSWRPTECDHGACGS